MASSTESQDILTAKNDLVGLLEQVAIQMYFSAGEFNESSPLWVQVKISWEKMNSIVSGIVPTPPPLA